MEEMWKESLGSKVGRPISLALQCFASRDINPTTPQSPALSVLPNCLAAHQPEPLRSGKCSAFYLPGLLPVFGRRSWFPS